MKSNFTMCHNQECVNADYCGRFTAMPQKRQTYKYFLNKGDTCDHIIPNEKYKTFLILSGKPTPNSKNDFNSLLTRSSKGRIVRVKMIKNRSYGPALYDIVKTREF